MPDINTDIIKPAEKVVKEKLSNGQAILMLIATVNNSITDFRTLSTEQFNSLSLRLTDVALIAHDALTKEQYNIKNAELLLLGEAARVLNVAQHDAIGKDIEHASERLEAKITEVREQSIPRAYIILVVAVVAAISLLIIVLLNAKHLLDVW